MDTLSDEKRARSGRRPELLAGTQPQHASSLEVPGRRFARAQARDLDQSCAAIGDNRQLASPKGTPPSFFKAPPLPAGGIFCQYKLGICFLPIHVRFFGYRNG
jgi:hypothetical protein